MCWPTAAAANWPMWPCPGPEQATHIYTTADDTAVAVEDLTADWQQERRPRWAIDTGLPATADAQQHEQDLDQRQRANVLAIAAHERTGPDSERTRAAIAAELDRYRARLDAVDRRKSAARRHGREPEWRQPSPRQRHRNRHVSPRARHREVLLPNVRLANGGVRQETRRRLMLTFNTPFFPEVLVASSVMAEGVDLHQDCRYVVHHDLAWNPSTLEQRTGRVDRIGSKAETSQQPVVVYEPYLAGTHDEKMFRVVKDRERWFGVVMGETPDSGERATEQQALRDALATSSRREPDDGPLPNRRPSDDRDIGGSQCDRDKQPDAVAGPTPVGPSSLKDSRNELRAPC